MQSRSSGCRQRPDARDAHLARPGCRTPRRSGLKSLDVIPFLGTTDHREVAMVYYHLALRYVRVFPGEFEIVCEGWDPEGDGGGEPAEGMVVTEYVVAPTRSVGEWGEAFVGFMRSGEAEAIYEIHGIQSVVG